MNSAITETTDGNGIGKNSPATRSVWGIGLAVPILALALRDSLAPWVWMWVMALALFVAAKCITVSRCLVSNGNIHPGRLLAYCLLWPGMDIAPFCTRSSAIEVTICEWVFATAKTIFGALLVWGAVPRLSLHHPLLSGWTGMIGLVFILHFGFFHLLSLLCRALGFNTRPIMSSPGTATSLSRFWGSSWNKAFSDLVHEQLFKPLAKPLGARRALFTVFLVSGLLHELVISLPARGGYGLPTAYFVIQSLGLLFERSRWGRAIGLSSGWKGWWFVLVIAGVPAFWLFHPVFIRNVILPMLHSIGAT